jgi:toxin ParE1/3/4
MAEFRLSPEAEAELDGIWLYMARESSVDIASRVVDSITERFWLLARHPYIGRPRDEDLRPGLRSFAAGDYVIIHRVERIEGDDVVLILHVAPGQRDVVALLGPQV